VGWEHVAGLEEHVLVESTQAVVFGRLGHRAVLGGDLDGDQREGVVLGDEDGETVRRGVLADGGRRGLARRRRAARRGRQAGSAVGGAWRGRSTDRAERGDRRPPGGPPG
jgi:hypothetical protein